MATNAEGESSAGEEAAATTAPDRPAAPLPPFLTANGPTEIQLSWAAPKGHGGAISAYRLERQLSGAGDAWEELSTDGTQTMATVPKGETTETVVFHVTAQNSAG